MAKKKADMSWVHRIAGISAQFHAQDMGYTLSIDYTTVLGKLPDSDTWIVRIDGSETDYGEYWWPTTKHLAVTGPEDHPSTDDATPEQIKQVSKEEQ